MMMRKAMVQSGLFLLLCILSGCEMFQPKIDNSYVRKGEVVELNLITYEEAEKGDLSKELGLIWGDLQPPSIVPDYKKGNLSVRGGVAADVAEKLIEMGVDWVAEQAKKEAAKYEAQFKQTLYDHSFWVNGRPKYAGFELVRKAEGYDSDSKVASRLVCKFDYAQGDPRLVLIRPIYYSIKAAKAKVAEVKGKAYLGSHITILMKGAWIDSDGVFQEADIANASMAIKNLKFKEEPNKCENIYTEKVENIVLGYFRTPPLSPDTVAGETLAYTTSLRTAYGLDEDVSNLEIDLGKKKRVGKQLGNKLCELKSKLSGSKAAKTAGEEVGKLNVDLEKQVEKLNVDLEKQNEEISNAAIKLDSKRAEYAKANEKAAAARDMLSQAWNGGAFRISVVVTENDESKFKDYLIRFGDYITERKPDIVKAAKGEKEGE